MKNVREEHSAKLRFTERIAELCAFPYQNDSHKYGGFFTSYQLETIARTIENLKTKVAELTKEVELQKAKQKS